MWLRNSEAELEMSPLPTLSLAAGLARDKIVFKVSVVFPGTTVGIRYLWYLSAVLGDLLIAHLSHHSNPMIFLEQQGPHGSYRLQRRPDISLYIRKTGCILRNAFKIAPLCKKKGFNDICGREVPIGAVGVPGVYCAMEIYDARGCQSWIPTASAAAAPGLVSLPLVRFPVDLSVQLYNQITSSGNWEFALCLAALSAGDAWPTP